MNEEMAAAIATIANYAGEEVSLRCFAIIEDEIYAQEMAARDIEQFLRETTDVGCYGYEPDRGYYDLEPITETMGSYDREW